MTTLQRLAAQGFGGRVIWLSGPSGSGKTTLARIIAEHVADKWFTRQMVGAELNTAALDDLERESHMYAGGKGGRAFIIDEAHGMRAAVQQRLDQMLEPVPGHVVWIFTTTWDGQETLMDGIDGGPLLSRCIPIRLTNQGLAKAFAEAFKPLAVAEGLDGLPIDRWVKAAQSVGNNGRALWQLVESGAMIGGAS